MDFQENVILKPKYLIADYQDGLVIASKDDGETFGLIDLKEDRKLNFKYSFLQFIPNSKNLFAVKGDENGGSIIDREGNIIFDCYAIRPYAKAMNTSGFYYNYSWGEYDVNNCLDWLESDYFNVSSCIESFLHPSGKSIDDLFGFAGMNPENCAYRLDLSMDDVANRRYDWLFPDETLESNKYGTVIFNLGFREIMTTTYDPEDFWELYPHYTYSNEPCKALIVECKLYSKAEDHLDMIKEEIDDVLIDLGYSNKTNDGKNTWFMNSDVKLNYQFVDDELIFSVYSL